MQPILLVVAAALTIAWGLALLFYVRRIAINTRPTSKGEVAAESWKCPRCSSSSPITTFKCAACGYSLT